jgi:hypothetical protein
VTGRDLESRYRRLLAVYPSEHRRRYEDEMLAVLLDGARPGQRRPGAGDAANVVVAGLRVRLGVTAQGFTGPAWIDPAAVVGLLAALALLALGVHGLLEQPPFGIPPAWAAREGFDTIGWLRVAGWGAVCASVLAGLRWPTVGLAWTAVVAEAVLLAPRYAVDPVLVVNNLWQLALGVIAAAALTVPAPRRRALEVLGVRRLLSSVLALTMVGAVFLLNQFTRDSVEDNETYYAFPLRAFGESRSDLTHDLTATSEVVLWLYLAGLVAAGLALLIVIATLAPPVRRRIVVLLAPIFALVVLVEQTLDAWADSVNYLGHPIDLVPAQWAALIGVPLVTFALGVLLIRQREQTLHMVALGRAADRERPIV